MFQMKVVDKNKTLILWSAIPPHAENRALYVEKYD
jgi:hypothetical protein